MPPNNLWKIHHRLQASLLTNSTCQVYQGIQDIESHQLQHDLLSTDDISDRFRRFAASLIYTLAYGRRMPRGNEHEVQEIVHLIKNVMEVALVENRSVDIFPVLECLPRQLSEWKRIADEFYHREVKLFTQNWKTALKGRTWSWSKALQGKRQARNITEKELSYAISSLYEAGSDTTILVLEVFILATALYEMRFGLPSSSLIPLLGSIDSLHLRTCPTCRSHWHS